MPKFAALFKDGKPTDQWYYAWKRSWAHCLSSGFQAVIEKDRSAWARSSNIKKYYNVVFKRLTKIGFMVPNEEFNKSSPWTVVSEKSGETRIVLWFWTPRGR